MTYVLVDLLLLFLLSRALQLVLRPAVVEPSRLLRTCCVVLVHGVAAQTALLGRELVPFLAGGE